MLSPQLAFSTGGMIAMLGWLALLVSLFVPGVRPHAWRATRLALPALLGIAYVILIAHGFGAAEGGGFGSITEVRALFANDAALAAGWLHYLAFDLFVGTWIAREGLAARVPALLLIPCLALTFLFGPAGLLLFLILRLALRGRAHPETRS